MKRNIKKVAVLGSGIMGSRIACHFANIGVKTLLLDIVPKEPNEKEAAKGLTIESKAVRNRIVNDSLQKALKSNPSPVYKKSFAQRIETGNFEDDMTKIAGCDWIIEAVKEDPKIKHKVYEQVEQHRKNGTLITTNTSGIPINILTQGRSEDFQKNFCGTHFFNPPRYLKLLEIIPGQNTAQEVIDFLMHYGDLHLGKTVVKCKDTPAFIANRVGIYSMMDVLHTMKELDLSVEEVDRLTGQTIGRPKSATLRTADVVGLDTFVHVARNLQESLKEDEAKDAFKLPDFLKKMIDNEWYGEKSGQGFYKKVKDKAGKSHIYALDLKSFEYKESEKPKFKTIESAKQVDKLQKRFKVLIEGDDKAGEFYRKTFFGLFTYVSNRIPEISDELYRIDDALKAGFGWEAGPFETWDATGLKHTLEKMEKAGFKPGKWVYDMIDAGFESFYKLENGIKHYYDINDKTYKPIPGMENFIILDHIRDDKTVWSNNGCSLIDLGDGILNIEFHSKMNTMGGEVITGINKGIDLAEKEYKGLVIGNNGPNFSAGANLALILMNAAEQEFDEIDFMIRNFQQTIMRARYSSIPVVVAPHNMTLGGGCELSMHGDHVQASAETYIGLVEFGVGLIPAGGGTKEMTMRVSDSFEAGDVEYNALQNAFMTIGTAKVATSAHEAIDMKILKQADMITLKQDRQIKDAKDMALELANMGYTQPAERKYIKVEGRGAMAMFLSGAYTMFKGHYISEHDKKISEKLAWVMCGGDLSHPAYVSEQYLLDLEREAFLSLCGEKKTMERMQHMLNTGKPLRN